VTAIDDLRAAVAELHRRVDAWHTAVEGVVAEADVESDALADPRLEDAQDRFYEALAGFEEASLPVLGLEPAEMAAAEPQESAVADEFFLHFVVALPDGQPPQRFDEALQIVDQCGFHVLEKLEEAGFHVPQFGSSRGEPATIFTVDEDDGTADDDTRRDPGADPDEEAP
jgi:hypothetical protein